MPFLHCELLEAMTIPGLGHVACQHQAGGSRDWLGSAALTSTGKSTLVLTSILLPRAQSPEATQRRGWEVRRKGLRPTVGFTLKHVGKFLGLGTLTAPVVSPGLPAI